MARQAPPVQLHPHQARDRDQVVDRLAPAVQLHHPLLVQDWDQVVARQALVVQVDHRHVKELLVQTLQLIVM
ncbi:MAG: hypothetical protein SFT81_00090 [Candidatus Caenarcaniphilales bacterium]|nr:hypothetical protein [Candidatus Caenarcaniphilales bacterium]